MNIMVMNIMVMNITMTNITMMNITVMPSSCGLEFLIQKQRKQGARQMER